MIKTHAGATTPRLLASVLGAGIVLGALMVVGETAIGSAADEPSVGLRLNRSAAPGDSEIYVMRADGSGQTNVTRGAARDGGPAWSPDGGRIAFHSTGVGGRLDVFVMSPDGSGRARITSSAVDDGWPTWSPDGTKLAFETTRGRGGSYYNREVFAMNSDGSGETNLTRNAVADFSPAWSPDGRRIAFASRGEIFVMSADGTGKRSLTRTAAEDGDPTWSPDGRQIAFTTYRPYRRCDANLEVYVMNADGSAQKNLSRSPQSDLEPAWSPDGSKVAFASRVGLNLEIFVMANDGSGKTNLTNASAFDDRFPSWSPDSSSIAFARGPAPASPLIRQGPRWRVPRVIGMKLKAAVRRLRRSVYFVGRIQYVRSERPRGRVVGQSEPPGRLCHPFDRLDLVVSRGH